MLAEHLLGGIYDAARQPGCPLLFVGDDFSRTDLRPVL
jgi:uncharacterized protein with PIN domain